MKTWFCPGAPTARSLKPSPLKSPLTTVWPKRPLAVTVPPKEAAVMLLGKFCGEAPDARATRQRDAAGVRHAAAVLPGNADHHIEESVVGQVRQPHGRAEVVPGGDPVLNSRCVSVVLVTS